MSGAGYDTRAAYDKKNKHRCQLGTEFAPAGNFTAVFRCFRRTSRGMTKLVSHAKPLDWKSQGEESDNTDPLASHHEIDSLDSHTMSCHRMHGY